MVSELPDLRPMETPPSTNPSSSQHTLTTFFSPLPKPLQNLISNLTTFVTVKLDDQNFTIWNHQIENAIFSSQLSGFIDGSYPCPSSPPPAVQEWFLIDRNIISSITATLSPSLILHFLEYKTSHTLLQAIRSRFAGLSLTHIHDLKKKLFKITKDSSMDAYLTNLKILSDLLAAAGAPVSNSDLVFLTLDGLPPEYATFRTNMRLKDVPISFTNLCNLLREEEIVHQQTSLPPTVDTSTALNTIKREFAQSSSLPHIQNYHSPFPSYPPRNNPNHFSNSTNRGRGDRFVRSGGRSRGGG